MDGECHAICRWTRRLPAALITPVLASRLMIILQRPAQMRHGLNGSKDIRGGRLLFIIRRRAGRGDLPR